ncbi:MAG: hypothetical protein ACKOZV_10490, partial [Bacteroidota bacterium]
MIACPIFVASERDVKGMGCSTPAPLHELRTEHPIPFTLHLSPLKKHAHKKHISSDFIAVHADACFFMQP